MSRRRAREHVFTLLFQMTFVSQEEFQEKIDLFFKYNNIKEEDKQYIKEEVRGVLSKLDTIDELLSQHSKSGK